MSHVHKEDGTDFIGKTTHAGIIPFARISTRTTDNQTGTLATGHFLHLLVVYEAGLGIDIILESLEHETREVDGTAVAQVTAVAQIETEKFVTGLQTCHEHGHVGLCSRVGLNVGPLCAKHLLEAVDSDKLCFVHHFTSAVITVAGIALGILVGEARAHGLHHLVTDEIFRGNKFDAFLLTLMFAFDDVEDCVVSLHNYILY